MPAHKKHPDQRRRRNKASTRATLTLQAPVDYSSWTAAEMRAEIDRRNEGRRPAERLRRTGNKALLEGELQADDFDIPPLPERPSGWQEVTRDWWTSVWSSPMSNEWHAETDYYNVLAAAQHLDDTWTAASPTARQTADNMFLRRIASLGLTPYDRRRLEWQIAAAGAATERRQRGKPEKPSAERKRTPSADPRRGLTAVS